MSAGSHTISVTFTPTDTTDYNTATQTVSITVNKTTLTVTPASPTITYGQSLPSYTASYSDFVNGDGSSVVAGSPSLTTSPATPSAAGTYTITAAAGTLAAANYSFSFATGTLTINEAALTVTPAAASKTYGSANPSFTGTVTGAISGDGITATYASGATASTAVGTYSSGANAIAATLVDPNSKLGNYSVTQNLGTLTINPATPTLSFATIPAQTFGNAPFTVSATSASTGAVTYSVTSGPATISGSTATLTGAGPVVLLASQSATSNYAAATANVTFVVNPATPTVAVASSANPVLVTNLVTLTATVSSSAGTPIGTVSFLDGTTPLGSGTLASGIATLTTSSLTVATHSITAVYSGSTNYNTATSTALSQAVEDFSVSAGTGGSSSQTVVPGGTATYQLALGPSNGTVFPAVVTLSVSGLPPGATATLTPNTLPVGASLTNVTLSIQLPQVTASLDSKQPPNRRIPSVLWGILLLPFAARLRKGGKRLGRVLSVMLLLAAGLAATTGLSGCGSGGYFGQTPSTYTIQVTATSGNLSHSISFTLTVE